MCGESIVASLELSKAAHERSTHSLRRAAIWRLRLHFSSGADRVALFFVPLPAWLEAQRRVGRDSLGRDWPHGRTVVDAGGLSLAAGRSCSGRSWALDVAPGGRPLASGGAHLAGGVQGGWSRGVQVGALHLGGVIVLPEVAATN